MILREFFTTLGKEIPHCDLFVPTSEGLLIIRLGEIGTVRTRIITKEQSQTNAQPSKNPLIVLERQELR